MPVSTSEKPPKQQCAIEITKNAILADGQKITGLDSVDSKDSLLIEPLFRWVNLQKAQCGDSLKGSEMMIQCDRDLEYLYVKRVMYSCSKAGFNRFTVLVIQEEQ